MPRQMYSLSDLFELRSGDFHTAKELDDGDTPLISCGYGDSGLVGYYRIPQELTYRNCITVAYNGQPLLAKYHPYRFGAKDDVAVLIPNQELSEETLLYIAAQINLQKWRYSYGRKCFREKLADVTISIPIVSARGNEDRIEEGDIRAMLPYQLQQLIPQHQTERVLTIPALDWQEWPLSQIFHFKRGMFHSLRELSPGSVPIISCAEKENGIAGFFDIDEGMHRHKLTIAMNGKVLTTKYHPYQFAAKDDVAVCVPRKHIRISSLLLIQAMLNLERWRYSYGRKCYIAKLQRLCMPLPIKDGWLDEEGIAAVCAAAPYWEHLQGQLRRSQCSDGPFVQTAFLCRASGKQAE